MIAMLDYSEVDMKVSDIGMETAGFNDYRGVSEDGRDANGVLVMMREKARFSYKDRQKFINPFIQSISRLCWVSQFYSRTKEQEESSGVT